MANCNKQQLNITCGTDVVLHDTLIFDSESFDPALSTGVTANLVSSLGKRTALEVEVADGGLIIYVSWVDGRNAGYYGLEVTGTCNSKKWATYADSLIHYTRATEMGPAAVEMESDYYDISQVIAYVYSNNPIAMVEATIDDNVGEPEVDVAYQNMKLQFAFRNILGDGILKIEQTETSDVSEGTNVVTVTTVGGKVFSFLVKNGAKGDTVILGDGVEYTLYNGKGTHTDGAMTQNAVTNALDDQYSLVLTGRVGNCYKGKALDKNGVMFDKNGWGCFKEAIPCVYGDTVTWNVKTVSESATDIYLVFFDGNMAKIGNYGQNTAGDLTRNVTVPSGCAYINASFQLTVATPLVINGTNYGSIVPLPGLYYTEDLEREIVALDGRLTHQENLDDYRLYVKSGVAYVADGSTEAMPGWSVNTNYIPCVPGDTVKFRYGKKEGSPRILFYNADKDFVYAYSANDSSGIRTLTVQSGRYYLRTSWYKTLGGAENTTPLIINGEKYFFDEVSKIPQMEEELYGKDTTHGVIGEYYPDEVRDIIAMGKVPSDMFKRLWFIHTSDSHGNIFGYAEDFVDYCKAKFVVNTGDLVQDRFTDSKTTTIASAISSSKPTYFVLGNHDYAKAPSKQAIFDAFYGNPETEGTVNHHNVQTGGIATEHTWYSVDYSTEKVKCIFLDMNDGWPDEGLSSRQLADFSYGYMSQAQIEWFISELQAARTSNLHVCIFIHILAVDRDGTRTIPEFTDSWTVDWDSQHTFLHDLVDKFMAGGTVSFTYKGDSYSATFSSGGHFVSWFCGHSHYDSAGWLRDYPNQFAVIVTKPNAQSGWGGMYEDDNLGVHWNFVVVDTPQKFLSVYRVGQQKTVWGIARKSFRIEYK